MPTFGSLRASSAAFFSSADNVWFLPTPPALPAGVATVGIAVVTFALRLVLPGSVVVALRAAALAAPFAAPVSTCAAVFPVV